MKELLILLLICHFTGDYYLQTDKSSREKDRKIRAVLVHSIIYSFPFLFFFIFSGLRKDFASASFISVLSHAIVDFSKFYAGAFLRRRTQLHKEKLSAYLYVTDQLIHISILIMAAFLWGRTFSPSAFPGNSLILGFSLQPSDVYRWILALILIYKPSNITFVKLFSTYKPGDIPPGEKERGFELKRDVQLKAGAVIGFLEKFIILMFLYENQPMAGGLVLTAKSIARYDKITKSPGFAEYYLIGTLTSLVQVMLIYYTVFKILK